MNSLIVRVHVYMHIFVVSENKYEKIATQKSNSQQISPELPHCRILLTDSNVRASL